MRLTYIFSSKKRLPMKENGQKDDWRSRESNPEPFPCSRHAKELFVILVD
jgi:hypothetical protein